MYMHAQSVSALFSSTYFGLNWGLRAERSGVIAVETLGSVDSLISVWTRGYGPAPLQW
jgi:hypothetical protein